jgi:hypothetical protein
MIIEDTNIIHSVDGLEEFIYHLTWQEQGEGDHSQVEMKIKIKD